MSKDNPQARRSDGGARMAKVKCPLDGKGLLLLLLYVPGYRGERCEPIHGRTRLTKMVFLFEKEVWPKFKFDRLMPAEALPLFAPYYFGPFSPSIYTDIDFLVNLQFISADSCPTEQISEEEALEHQWWLRQAEPPPAEPMPFASEVFRLTAVGKAFAADRLMPGLSQAQQQALSSLKARCTSVRLRELLRYVYSRHPEYAVSSLIREDILSGKQEDSRVSE